MRRSVLLLIILLSICAAKAQRITRQFNNVPLSEALLQLSREQNDYTIIFIYNELEDFTVTKTVKRGRSLPDAVREVCGFYPVRVSVKGHDILVECIQKDRTKLTGRLVGPDRQPVAYANITLSSLSDTTYIGGGVSNEAGDFVIPCSAAQARVRISCVGFKTIERVMPISNAGTIRMQMEDYYLNNITVSGRIPIIRSESDRLQYIVSNDEFARGLNAHELLSRVPTVTMIGSQVMILGKWPARFMLNGHNMDMSDEAIQQKLWTIRSEDIDRIEVLATPFGRDMTEMGGGYINIVMRRDQTLGWRGNISTEAGSSDDWSGRANGSVNYASEKFDMTIDANGGRMTQTTDNLTTYVSNSILLSNTHAKQKNKELAANLTLRYQPTKNLELGGMLSWQTQWPEKVTYGEANLSEFSSISEAHQDPDDNTTTKSLTAYCDWRLDSKGKLLSLSYSNYKKDDDGKSNMNAHNYQNGTPLIDLGGFTVVKSEDFESNVDYHIQSARFDLTLPLNFATIDVGASYTNIDNQAYIMNHQRYSTLDMNYIDRSLDYQEKTRAAYLSLHKDWNNFAIKLGIRHEHIKMNEEEIVNSDIWKYNYTKTINNKNDYWLPSLSMSYKVEGHHISLSWGTSCLRPNFYDLNPFRIYKSASEYSEGNPLLSPSRISNIELNYHNRHGLFVCAYHHHSSDKVILVTSTDMYRVTDINLMTYATTKPQNIGRINQTGLYLRYQRYLSNHLMATAEVDAFYHDATAKYDEIECHLNEWGSRIAISADWYLNSPHTLLLNARYQHWFADYRDMTRTDSYGYFYFAVRYAMLNDRLKLSLVANDPFRQYVTDEAIYNSKYAMYDGIGRNMKQHLSHTNHHSHYIGLTATYSFGGKKEHHIRHNIENTESKRAVKQ